MQKMENSTVQSSRKIYLFMVIFAWLEVILFSGLMFGWASFVYIYKAEGYFDDGCSVKTTKLQNNTMDQAFPHTTFNPPDDATTKHNNDMSNLGSRDQRCASQDARFNLVFTIGQVISFLMPIPNGFIMDYFGLRVSRLLAMLSITTGSLMFAFMTSGTSFLLFPALSLLGAGGYFLYVESLPLANLIPTWKSTIVAVLAGAYGTSAFTPVLFKTAYSYGIQPIHAFIFYSILVAVSLSTSAVLWFPKAIPWPMPDDFQLDTPIMRMCNCSKRDNEPTINNVAFDQNIDKSDDKESNSSTLDTSKETSHETADDNKIVQATSVEIVKNTAGILDVQPANIKEKLSYAICKPNKRILYGLGVLYLCVMHLRMSSFVGVFNPWISRMANQDLTLVSSYTSVWSYCQLLMVPFSFICGRLNDWKWNDPIAKMDPQLERIRACIASFFLSIGIAILLSILMSIPVMKLQYLTFVVFALYRGSLYGPITAFVYNAFPSMHFGKLWGFMMASAGVFNLLQYPLFAWMQVSLDGSVLYVNLLQIGFILIGCSLPLYVWFYWKTKSAMRRKEMSKMLLQPSC